VLRTSNLDRWLADPQTLAAELPALGPAQMSAILAGEGHQYVPFAGQSAGLIHDIRPAADIVRSVVDEADAIIRGLAPRLGETARHLH
jgi:hypothetical protein